VFSIVVFWLKHHDRASVARIGGFALLYLKCLREKLGASLRHKFVYGKGLWVVRVLVL